MEKSIRTELMESFGITKEEAVALIRTYARNHNGQVNLTQIKKDVEHIVDTMIHNVGNVYKDYDIQHELTECGKDRTQEAMRTLMGTPENEELVESYLINRYANNVGIWADTFYKAAQKKILETLDKGIESYRDLVKQLPYENINRVANTFGIELDVADFLSINGTPEDFQKFMTSTRPLRKNDDIERKGCPKDLSDKIFTELQIEDHYGTLNCFSRDGIMRGLSSIYNATGLTPEEKEKAQNLFIRDFLEHGYEEEFIRLCRTEIPQKFEVMQEYLQMSPDTPWEEKHSFFDEKVLPEVEAHVKGLYQEFFTDLKQRMENGDISAKEFKDLLADSELIKDGNGIYIYDDDETKKPVLCLSTGNPITMASMHIEMDGEELNSVIDTINKNELDKAKEQIDAITKKGIGETQILHDYNEYRFQYSEDKSGVLGVLGEEEDSPYIVGGKLIDGTFLRPGRQLTDLEIKVPYKVLLKDVRDFQCVKEVQGMTPEQIQQFNHGVENIKTYEHSYTYGRVDGYYSRNVLDFEIDGKKYHIRDADWTNGGWYTIMWSGDEENYPEEGIGFSSSYSEWARAQSGVNEEWLMGAIAENPSRFAKYYDEYKDISDSCGRFPTKHIERIYREIMQMEPESKLRARQSEIAESDQSKEEKAFVGPNQPNEEAFAERIVENATERLDARKKDEAAKELLSEYETQIQEQGVSKDDD